VLNFLFLVVSNDWLTAVVIVKWTDCCVRSGYPDPVYMRRVSSELASKRLNWWLDCTSHSVWRSWDMQTVLGFFAVVWLKDAALSLSN